MIEFLKDLFTADKHTITSINRTVNELTEYFCNKQDTSLFPTRRVVIEEVNNHVYKCQDLHSDIGCRLEEMKANGDIRYIDGEGYHGKEDIREWRENE